MTQLTIFIHPTWKTIWGRIGSIELPIENPCSLGCDDGAFPKCFQLPYTWPWSFTVTFDDLIKANFFQLQLPVSSIYATNSKS